MKLTEGFITHDTADEQIIVDVKSRFSGLVRSNETAAFIVNCLKAETDRNAIICALYERYDASKEQLGADVDRILDKLRSIGALNE